MLRRRQVRLQPRQHALHGRQRDATQELRHQARLWQNSVVSAVEDFAKERLHGVVEHP